jgi:hypothetical protein
LKKALDVLDELRHTPRRAFITCVDISQGKRAVVRFTSGTQISGDQDSPGTLTDQQVIPGATEPARTEVIKPARKNQPTEKEAGRNSEAKNRDRAREH